MDPLETGRQDVLQKAIDERGPGHAQCALLAAGGIGADAQEHVVALNAQDTLVGDGYLPRMRLRLARVLAVRQINAIR